MMPIPRRALFAVPLLPLAFALGACAGPEYQELMPMSAKVSTYRSVLIFVDSDENVVDTTRQAAFLKDRITTLLGQRFPNLRVVETPDQVDFVIHAKVAARAPGEPKVTVDVEFDDRNKETVGHVKFAHASTGGAKVSVGGVGADALEAAALDIVQYLYERR
jgi:hypothetical protein